MSFFCLEGLFFETEHTEGMVKEVAFDHESVSHITRLDNEQSLIFFKNGSSLQIQKNFEATLYMIYKILPHLSDPMVKWAPKGKKK